MSVQHRELAEGRWITLSFVEQMANIGGEVERALNWREKNNADYSQRAFERAIELVDLTLDDGRNISRFGEVARVREALTDYFAGTNQYGSTGLLWRKYFGAFGFAARRDR
jgi:hypothetical protein